jgi:hypothetical protein
VNSWKDQKVLKSNSFGVGFISGLLVSVGLNVYSLQTNWHGFDQFGTPGFPFAFADDGYLFSNVRWLGFIGDILFAVLFSFILGSSLDKLTHRRSIR